MARSGARPERSLRTLRDAALLLFVAAALIAGLVHYGVLISEDDPATSSSGAVATASSAPSSTPPTGGGAASREPSPAPATAGSDSVAATAGPSSSPTTSGAPPPPAPTGADGSSTSGDPSLPPTAAPSEPATTTTTTGTDDDGPATCWDGRTATRLNLCGSPSGEQGLRWVFPSLARTDVSCHPAPRPAGAYETVVGLECFGSVDGHPFSVTYEQVASRAAAQAAIDRSYANGSSYDFPGARGGRCTWFDPNGHPARVSGYYKGFPFVVSVFAPSPQVVKKAWAQQVVLRPAGAIRGLRAGASGSAGSVD